MSKPQGKLDAKWIRTYNLMRKESKNILINVYVHQMDKGRLLISEHDEPVGIELCRWCGKGVEVTQLSLEHELLLNRSLEAFAVTDSNLNLYLNSQGLCDIRLSPN